MANRPHLLATVFPLRLCACIIYYALLLPIPRFIPHPIRSYVYTILAGEPSETSRFSLIKLMCRYQPIVQEFGPNGDLDSVERV